MRRIETIIREYKKPEKDNTKSLERTIKDMGKKKEPSSAVDPKKNEPDSVAKPDEKIKLSGDKEPVQVPAKLVMEAKRRAAKRIASRKKQGPSPALVKAAQSMPHNSMRTDANGNSTYAHEMTAHAKMHLKHVNRIRRFAQACGLKVHSIPSVHGDTRFHKTKFAVQGPHVGVQQYMEGLRRMTASPNSKSNK